MYLRFMISAGNPKVGCQLDAQREFDSPYSIMNKRDGDGIGIHVALRTQILGVRVPLVTPG